VPSVGQNATDPAVAPDGKRLAFSQFYADSNIWKLDPITGRKEKLIASTQTDTSPQYSRDGKWIAFRSSRSGTNEVWIASASGGSEQQITTFNNTLSGCPRWSPDGRYLAFDSRPEGQPDIFVIDLQTKQVRRITDQKAEDVVPSWSSDVKWIYFSSSRSGSWQIWKKASDGTGEAIRVTNSGGFAPMESPDGQYIYYAKGRSVAGLWRIRIDGTGEEEVLPDLPAEHWGLWAVLADGDIVYLDRQGQSASVLKRFRGGKTSVIATLDKPPKTADAGLASSPDGRTILVSQVDQSGSDIQMVESPDIQ
jgi:Tol biopolymer transport system component